MNDATYSKTAPAARKPLAVITGASSGIGTAFAEKLAARGMDLVIIARRREQLEQLAHRLERTAAVRVSVLAADLTERSGLQSAIKAIEQLDGIDLLVNSAGSAIGEDFVKADPVRIERELFLDLSVPMLLTRAALPSMIARKSGTVVNVSSSGGFVPAPRFATYTAAKAGLTRFTEALCGELAGTGVRVHALCPGAVATDFINKSGYRESDVPKVMLQSPETCVEAALRALDRGTVVYIPHIPTRLFVGLLSLLPLSWKLKVLGGAAQKSLGASV